nr:MAG TPA: hypothetical protein [Caudoviricetes sp.]
MLNITLQCTSVVVRWCKHHPQEDIQKPGIRREQRYGYADIIIIREDGIMYYVILPVGIRGAVEDRNQYNRHPEFRLYSGFLDRKENIYGNSNA